MSQGIDIREPSAVIVEELLLDADGAIITSGAATLRIAERQSDGTLRTFDFNDNTFKTTTVTTETAAPTHRQLNNGATDTGVWTFVQSTVGGFTAGRVYLTFVEHDDLPSPIVRKFQWGIASGSLDLYSDQVSLIDGAITAAKIATDAIDADAVKADAVTKIQSGLATAANQGAAPGGMADWRPVKKGSTSQSVLVQFIDDVTGEPETGVNASTPGLSISAWQEGSSNLFAPIQYVDLASKGSAWTEGGIKHIANGVYRYDPPNASFSGSTGDSVTLIGTATGMRMTPITIPLVDYDPYDAVRLGLTTLANSAGGTATAAAVADVQTAVDGLSGGNGARTVAITITDTDDTPLESVRVRVTKGAESYVLSTNVSGVATFALDDGTWTVVATLSQYSFDNDPAVELVVNGDETATYEMTQLVTPSEDPDTVTGYLICYDAAGQPEAGVPITLRQTAYPSGSTGGAFSGVPRTVVSAASTGLVEFTGLFVGAQYEAQRPNGSTEKFTVTDTDPFPMPSIFGWA